jgi:hypothetical protein
MTIEPLLVDLRMRQFQVWAASVLLRERVFLEKLCSGALGCYRVVVDRVHFVGPLAGGLAGNWLIG